MSFLRLYLWCILLLVCGYTSAYAKQPFRSVETRSSGISVNLNWMQMADASFSPLRYEGPGIDFKILSAKSYGNRRRHLYLGAQVDYLRNRLDFQAHYIQPGLGWGLTFLVPDLSSDDALSYMGGTISARTRIYRFVNEDPDHIYWSTSYTLDFHYFFDLEINRDRKVFAELNLPLAGLLSRPAAEIGYTFQLPGFGEHMKRIHENFGFATLNSMQSANLKLIVDLKRTRIRSLSVGYEVDFTRFTKPEPVIYLSNSLLLRMYFDAFVW
jgi:hypothetical protein